MDSIPVRSTDSQRLVLRAAFFCLLSLWNATTALAQLGGGLVYNPQSDANVVSQELSRHLPATGVRKYSRYVGFLRWETTHTLSLMAETRQGLSSRFWKSDTRSWSGWVHHGNPTGAPVQRISGSGDSPGIDTSLTMLSGYGSSYNDWIVYQGFGRPVTGAEPDFKTAIMQVDSTTRSLNFMDSDPNITTVRASRLPADYDHFNPQTGYSSPSPLGSWALMRHVFGTGVPRGSVRSTRFITANIPLIELRRDHNSTQTQWIDHGRPSGATGVDVGPGGAVSVIHNYLNASDPLAREETRYVFVATNPIEDGYGEGLNGDQIAYRQGRGGNFSWNSLGSPGGLVYGPPLAIPYYTNIPIAGGLGRVVVFAVSRNGSGSYVLKSRYHDGNGWDSGWQHWGAPASLGGDKFKLTSAVVYWNGTPNQMANLRINAFGYSEENGSRVGQLVEFYWDGATWRFAQPRQAPDGQSFRTAHASVIDEGSRDRIVVVGRTSTGRIYEFAREIESGQVVSERWTDLSWEPLTLYRTNPF